MTLSCDHAWPTYNHKDYSSISSYYMYFTTPQAAVLDRPIHSEILRIRPRQVSQSVQMVPNYYGLAGCIYCRADCGATPSECSFFFVCSVLKRTIEGRKTDFMKPAGSACGFGCKMTAKKLDCTGSLCLGVGWLFHTRYGHLSG